VRETFGIGGGLRIGEGATRGGRSEKSLLLWPLRRAKKHLTPKPNGRGSSESKIRKGTWDNF